MHGAVIYGKGDVRFETRKDPEILEPTDAIVRTIATCVCGSDLWRYRGINEVPEPTPIGHEYVGVVEGIGEDVRNVKPGDFVVGGFTTSDNTCPVCRKGATANCQNGGFYDGCQAEKIRVAHADGTLVSIPGGVDRDLVPSLLTLSDVACTGWHGAVSALAGPGRSVAVVGDGAVLTVVTVQGWDDAAVHASNHRACVEGGGALKHVVVSLGGDTRIAPDLGFSGEGGRIDAYGVYFTDAGQHQEHRPYVAHTEPHCYSRVTYKGALQGDAAHAVWVGDCLIGAGARGTDTYELNRNLVLTPGAKADSIPNLEIENGNIEGAGHASATGRFDDAQLFYLRARGIPEREARRLVVLGFFNEIVSEIGVPEVEERLMTAIEHELELTGLIQAGPGAPADERP